MLCPACGHENAQTHRFCAECGTALITVARARDPWQAQSYTPHLTQTVLSSRAAVEGEKKLVTVMFCDIANSTQLASAVGAEAMHSLLEHFFELALAEVHRVEGTINQFLGDGFMALFGAPVSHEDHGRRALMAALQVRQRLRESGSRPLRDLRVRIGVHTGLVVVGKIGDNLRRDYTAVGETTNLAARVQQRTSPGSICVTESAQRATQEWFTFRSLGKAALKGIAEPCELFDLIDVRHSDSIARSDSSVVSELVERESELATLVDCLYRARTGQGSVVIVQGEAGVGKSRLIAEARRRRGSESWVEGRAVSFGGKLTYWPFIRIMQAWFGIDDNDSEIVAWSKLERAAAELFAERAIEVVPYLATVLSLPLTGEHEERVKFLDTRALGSQVLLSMRELFERQAQRSPTIVLLEDWHWVDQASVALCEHLLPLAGSVAISFWFVTRAEPEEPASRIRDALKAQPTTLSREISLVPLTVAGSMALIENIVGVHGLTGDVRQAILRRTEGNPFFIEEILRSLIADGSIVRDVSGTWFAARPIDAAALPDTVQGVIGARIDRLEEDLKSALKFASVIGRNFFLRVLRLIVQSGEGLEDSLKRLEVTELIRLRRQTPEVEYMFNHALVQEAAYNSILFERRRGIHRSVAQAIETLFADRIDEFTGLLAYHYAMAEDWEGARLYLFKAGDQAGRMAADVEALDYYRQAERAYLKVAGAALTPLQRATFDRKLGQALYGVGQYNEAVEHLSRALGNLGIAYPSTRAGVRLATIKYLLAHFLLRITRRFANPKQMDLAVAQEISIICQSLVWLDYFVDPERFALDGLIELYAGERSDDIVGRVRGLGSFGAVLMTLGVMKLAGRRIDEAVALAEQSGFAAAIGGARFVRGWLDWISGSAGLGSVSLETAARAYRSIGDLRRWGGPSYFLVWIALQRGDHELAAALASELVRVGEDSRDPHVVTWGLTAQGIVGITIGPLEEAIGRLERVREMCTAISSFRQLAEASGGIGRCLLKQGRLEEAEPLIEEAVHLIESRKLRGHWSSSPFNACAELRVRQAECAPPSTRPELLRIAARACDAASRYAKGAPTWMPETERQLGLLALIRGDLKSVERHWDRSVALATSLQLPVQRARTLLERGLRMHEHALVDEAIAVFTATGAHVDLAIAEVARQDTAVPVAHRSPSSEALLPP
jgi:class 3 adenylate cyclase/tetratricopeptide (TPR) repeat protein